MRTYQVILAYRAECCSQAHLFSTRVAASSKLEARHIAEQRLAKRVDTLDLEDISNDTVMIPIKQKAKPPGA